MDDRYGYRRITVMLGDAGRHVNHKRVERIWKREGLKVAPKQPKDQALAQRRLVRPDRARAANHHR